MTLREIVEKYGFNRIAQKAEGQAEPLLLIRDFNDEVYEVEGTQSNAIYTERKDADGYNYVPSWNPGACKTSVASQ